MKKYVLISNEKFYYEEEELFVGRNKIDREISKQNLEIFHSIIKETNIQYGLIYGSLLGAIREKNFIEHDEDTDLFVLSEFKSEFLKLLPTMKARGLELVRSKSDLMSLMLNNQYIDVYFFKPKRFFFRKERTSCGAYRVNAKYLEKQKFIDFLGMEFPIPQKAEEFLEEVYGKDWKIPKVGYNAQKNTLKEIFFARFPSFKQSKLYKVLHKIYVASRKGQL